VSPSCEPADSVVVGAFDSSMLSTAELGLRRKIDFIVLESVWAL
jgi:hypothetical protein